MTNSAVPASILVAEDNQIDRMLIERKLKTYRIENTVVYAENGLDALEILRGESEQSIQPPFVVLLDLHMPKMNGFEFLDALRADPELAATPVIVLSTSDDEVDVAEARSRGVAAYMTKQEVVSDFPRLIEVVQSLELSIRSSVVDEERG